MKTRTRIDIDAKLLEQVLMATGEKTKSKAVHTALEKYVRDWGIAELLAAAGKVDIVDNLQELEELEIEKQKRLSW